MNCSVIIDWRFVVALGAAIGIVVISLKMDSASAERVSIHAIDAYKGYAVAISGDR